MQLTCLSAPPQHFPAVARNLPLAAGLPVTNLADFFKYTWSGSEPAGTYTLFLVLTPAGALDDGEIGPDDMLATGAQAVTFTP
jgi:hypothetical protein